MDSTITGFAAKLLLFLFVCGSIVTTAEARTNYGLIVGVTKYPNLPEKTWLVGPNNDALLVRSYLTEHAGFDPENVTVLADGIENAKSPTLSNIRAAMKTLAEKIKRDGDEEPFVYLHFSGHGSQMPARVENSENDGKDEIFLPADTMKWDSDINGFPNAYVDDDIGADIRMLRETGAFVWAVFDACHSSSATRAAPGEVVEVSRRLDPTVLGMPEDVVFSATRAIGNQRENPVEGSDDDMGGLVAFFAAQTVETTPEMPLPREADDPQRYGLFTYTLIESIAKHPGISYRRLGQTILQAYSAMNRRAPTPLYEGALDTKVFGVKEEPPVTQWPLKVDDGRITVEAGLVHGLAKGSTLALLANPADEIDKAKGYLEVTSAKNLSSKLKPVAYNDMPVLSDEALEAGGWVRPAELAISFELTVSRPGPGEMADGINASLDRLAADKTQLFRIKLVDEGEPADLALAITSEKEILRQMEASRATAGADEATLNEIEATTDELPRLWFLPPSGDASLLPGLRPPSLKLGLEEGDDPSRAGRKLDGDLAERLTKIFRATNLARMTEASDFRNDKLSVTFLIKRYDTDEFEEIEAGKVPFVSDDDEIHVRIENGSSRAVDLNVLHIATDYTISVVDPVRIERGGSEEIGLFAVNTETLGVERLIAIVTEAEPGTDVEDLRFLAQGGLRAAEADKGYGEESGLVGMLYAMGKQAKSRGGTLLGKAKGAKGAVWIYPVETVIRN